MNKGYFFKFRKAKYKLRRSLQGMKRKKEMTQYKVVIIKIYF